MLLGALPCGEFENNVINKRYDTQNVLKEYYNGRYCGLSNEPSRNRLNCDTTPIVIVVRIVEFFLSTSTTQSLAHRVQTRLHAE